MKVATELRIGTSSQLVLPASPRAVRNARAFVEHCCHTAGVEGDTCDTAVLLASEAVTNAIVHGRSSAHMSVTVGNGVVLVEVWDDNSTLPQLVETEDDAVTGRGLVIIDTLAARWGTIEHRNGKTVWFEVLIDSAAQTMPTTQPPPARRRTP